MVCCERKVWTSVHCAFATCWFAVSMVHGCDRSASVITRLNIFPLIAFAFIPRCVPPLLHGREDCERAKKSECMTVEECVTNRNIGELK